MKGAALLFALLFTILNALPAMAREYHVSVHGSDSNAGTAEHPFETIAMAVQTARAGDTITVHEGTYREWVNPLYGGTSNANRILYRAAEGEKVAIKGSEIIKGWKQAGNNVWKVTLDNAFFGDYNPYQDKVGGDWFLDYGRVHHTGEVYLNGNSLYETDAADKLFNPKAMSGTTDRVASLKQWYCSSDEKSTTIWANFQGADPNKELVEINVRPVVFYPSSTGINYITVRGFTMSQAATNWAPPTAEQKGLIGPHWSKGWIIEDNIISDSKCSGISLGIDRQSGENYAAVYKKKSGHISQLETVFRALNNGWSKDNIGSHIIRNNTIFNCEQTGICGNLGAVFSEIYNNHIYNIYTKRQWGGFEMAGIKLHAAIDVLIKGNCIHDAFKGMWIDWEAQGIRISDNLLYNNSWMDLHLEVSHGPQIVDNNLFLSDLNVWNLSTGTAFIQNLFAGQLCRASENERFTPYHYPHSTSIAGIMTTQGGDDRFYNNVFVKRDPPPYDIFEKARRPKREKGTMDFGLKIYESFPSAGPVKDFAISEMSTEKLPVTSAYNLYLNGAVPGNAGMNEKVLSNSKVQLQIEQRPEGIFLRIRGWDRKSGLSAPIVTSAALKEALVAEAAFENPDGSAVIFNTDYFSHTRNNSGNEPGPFATINTGESSVKVWPLNR